MHQHMSDWSTLRVHDADACSYIYALRLQHGFLPAAALSIRLCMVVQGYACNPHTKLTINCIPQYTILYGSAARLSRAANAPIECVTVRDIISCICAIKAYSSHDIRAVLHKCLAWWPLLPDFDRFGLDNIVPLFTFWARHGATTPCAGLQASRKLCRPSGGCF